MFKPVFLRSCACCFTLFFASAHSIPSPTSDQRHIPSDIEQSIYDNFQKNAQEPGAAIFTPPSGWKLANPNELPPHVKVMVVGKGNSALAPSISLSTEETSKTLNEYLKIVKSINASKGSNWKDLGIIRTQAGDASLSQVDTISEWGNIRMMHVILARNGTIYILTAAALKEEFSKFYKTFFESLRSLRINNDSKEMACQRTQEPNMLKFLQKNAL